MNKFFMVLPLVLAGLMIRVDVYIVNISLPDICKALKIDISQSTYIILIYLILLTCIMMLFGKLGDRIGLKKMLLAGFLIFIISSGLCGISINLLTLVLSRAIQGFGGAMMFVAAFALIPRVLSKNNIGWGYGMWSTFVALGVTIGAPMGGIIAYFSSWHWIFFINIPIGLTAFILAKIVIPADVKLKSEDKTRINYLGIISLGLGLAFFIIAVSELGKINCSWKIISYSFTACILLLLFFIINEKKSKVPLFERKLFANGEFKVALSCGVLGFIMLAGNSFLLPFYMINFKGYSTETSGFMLLLYSIPLMFAAPPMGNLADRIKFPMKIGGIAMLLILISYVFFLFTFKMQSPAFLIIYLICCGLFFGVFCAPNNRLSMSAITPESRGIAAALYQTCTNLGMILGVAFFGLIISLNSRYSLKSINSHSIITSNAFIYSSILGITVAGIGFLVFTLNKRKYPNRNKNYSN